MANFLRILSQLKNYWVAALLNVLFNILAVIFSLASIVMIIPFLELLFDKKTPLYDEPTFKLSVQFFIDYFYFGMSWFIHEQGQTAALVFICVFVVIVFFLKNLFRYLALFFMAPIRNGIVRDLRKDMYGKILNLPVSYFSEEKKGDMISKMTSDLKEIEHSIMSTLEVTFKEPITIIAYLAAMLAMSGQLTLFVLLMILITAGIIGQIGKTLKRESTKGQQKLGVITSIIDESLSGLRIIKAFNAERYLNSKFARENEGHYNITNGILRRKELSSPLSEFLAIIIVSVVLWFGGRLVLSGDGLEAETFIGFMVIFSQLIPPSKSFASAFYNIQRGLASSERIYEVLDSHIDIMEKENAKPISTFRDSIEFKDVCFTYNNYDDKLILQNINLNIKKGKMIALVGPSGAGKTTMINLLPRFYDVDSGSISIDGINVKHYKIGDLRNILGIVTQESFLFNDTIKNNIAFGNEQVTDDEIIEAAKVANAHDFIEKLSNGYDTVVGDRGDNLSGGQKQRITIARAILSDPPILIMDEATSSLDTESEKLVQDALYKLMQNRTSIVIAHRLSTIQYADEIVVMDDGKILERGNHIGLMAKNGLYKKLVDLQAF
ncbi:MAG: ABC transporter ATP-binding protein [Chitinophagales bacterium]